MLTEQEKLDAGTHVRCRCWNLIPIENIECPKCHRFNAASNKDECSTCGAKKEHWKKPEPTE